MTMDFNIKSCSQSTLGNTGVPSCEFVLAMSKKVFITDKDFFFTEKPTKELVQTAIQERKLFPLTVADEVSDASTEAGMHEPASGESRLMVHAKDGYELLLTLSPHEYRNLLTFDGGQYRIFMLDHKGNLQGTDLDGDKSKFAGYLTDEFAVKNMTKPSDRTTPRQTPVFFKFADNMEVRKRYAAFPDMEFLNQINGLLDATVTVTDEAVDGCTVTVTSTATQKGVSGLVIADFVFKDSASGVEVTPSSVTESADTPGEYAVVATFTAGTYTADLLAPASMVTEGWDSTGPAEFTTTP